MRLKENSWLLTKPIAHRGLWSGDIIENSITAYSNAIKKGYPIEIDVFLTTDEHLVCFHDDSLERMTGIKGLIYEKSLSELKALNLNGSLEKIPTLNELLEIAENKTPLLIEIKNQPNKKVVDKLVARLKNYKGEFAIQSFNPLYISRVKKLAPEFIRGILADPLNQVDNKLFRYIVRKMPLNFIVKPDFLSINYNGLPLKKSKSKNYPVIAWTITDQTAYNIAKNNARNVIFEHFIPND